MLTAAELAAVVLIVAANAFFVAAEYALVTVRRTRLQELEDAGQPAGPAGAAAAGRPVPVHLLDPARRHHLQPGPGRHRRAGGERAPEEAARSAARQLARRRGDHDLGHPRLHHPVVLPRGDGRDRAQVVHAGERRARRARGGRPDRVVLHPVPAVHLGAGSTAAAPCCGWIGLPPPSGDVAGALGGGAEDARHRQPPEGRAGGGGAGDAAQGVRVRRQGRRRRDGAAAGRGRDCRSTCPAPSCWPGAAPPVHPLPGLRRGPGRHHRHAARARPVHAP